MYKMLFKIIIGILVFVGTITVIRLTLSDKNKLAPYQFAAGWIMGSINIGILEYIDTVWT